MPPRLALPSSIQQEVTAALRQAQRHPAHRSQILGDTALGLAAKSASPAHHADAKVLRAFADRLARAALSSETLGGSLDEEGLPGPATRDDFQETLADFDQAHAEYGDDLDTLARADDLADERTFARSPRISLAPLAWGAGATLGRAGKFKYEPTPADIAQNVSQAGTLAYWQGEPHEAQAITVDLGVPAGQEPPPLLTLPFTAILPPPIPDTSSRPRGIISYGSDGAVTRVPVDASFGARLTVVGNYVAVQIAMDPPEPGALSGIVAFSASLGAFASPSQAPPFYTVFIDGLVNNTQTDGLSSRYSPIPRPSHATFLLAVLSDELVGSVLLKFYGQGAARILSQFVYPIGALLQPLPLPADVQYIVLKNQTGNVGSFRLVFQIAL